MRMRNTNLKQNEHVFGLLSGKWGGLLYTTHAQYHLSPENMLDGCIAHAHYQKHAHFFGPEITRNLFEIRNQT